jgi:hypothetical protein
MNTRKTGDEVDRIVAQIDQTRVAEHWRNPDRPNGQFVKPVRRQDPKITRAKTRARTAIYRNRLDQRGAPSTAQIGMSLVCALVTAARSDELTEMDRGIVRRALQDLQKRGFSIVEARNILLKLRARIVDPADGGGESTESTGDSNSSPVF